MKPQARKYIGRALLPRALVALDRFRRKLAKLGAALRRTARRDCRLELYFAFDDPYSAVALPQVVELARRRNCNLLLFPVDKHGLENDPDGALRRAYNIVDAKRLGRAVGIEFVRSTPLDSRRTNFLAAWAEAAREAGKIEEFSIKAFEKLWFSDDSEIRFEDFISIFEQVVGRPPPREMAVYESRASRNSRSLYKKGHWEVPAVRVAGQWYFAHERMAQIEDYLEYLGW